MSGTSADGVDAAIVAIRGRGPGLSARLMHHAHLSYSDMLKRRIFAARATDARITLAEMAGLTFEVSRLYAQAVRDVLSIGPIAVDQIEAIAAHGQTVYHAPPVTMQWLDPSLLAAETGCRVVSDFRRADCAAGGQGAPLVPLADYLLFRHATRNRALLNIGGIANVTFLRAGGDVDDLIAFDTGPGNCISDHLCRTLDPAGRGFDPAGQRASSGTPDRSLTDAFLRNSHFSRRPPKSTDGPEMIDIYRVALATVGESFRTLESQLATACLITSRAVIDGLGAFCPSAPHDLIVSGGGTENRTMMAFLRQMAGEMGIEQVLTSDDLGIPSAAKEAIAFALLGAATLDGVAGNVPAATGARRRVVLGSITPQPCPHDPHDPPARTTGEVLR